MPGLIEYGIQKEIIMSRSKGDQRGKRLANEISGRSAFSVIEGRLIKRIGGEEVGSPLRKREAKSEVVRMRRREGTRAAVSALREA